MVTFVPLLHFILYSNILFNQIGLLLGAPLLDSEQNTTLPSTDVSNLTLLSSNKHTWQSESDYYHYLHIKSAILDSKYAVDGDKRQSMSHYSSNACTRTKFVGNPYWKVYLEVNYTINRVVVYGRLDDSYKNELIGTKIQVMQSDSLMGECGEIVEVTDESYTFDCDLRGDTVRLTKIKDGFLSLCEVEVFGTT